MWFVGRRRPLRNLRWRSVAHAEHPSLQMRHRVKYAGLASSERPSAFIGFVIAELGKPDTSFGQGVMERGPT